MFSADHRVSSLTSLLTQHILTSHLLQPSRSIPRKVYMDSLWEACFTMAKGQRKVVSSALLRGVFEWLARLVGRSLLIQNTVRTLQAISLPEIQRKEPAYAVGGELGQL